MKKKYIYTDKLQKKKYDIKEKESKIWSMESKIWSIDHLKRIYIKKWIW